MSDVLSLVQALIARPSVTPDDAGCQALLIERLEAIGFTCETIASGGVTTLDDIRALMDLVPHGVEGAIAGTALYEGRFSLEDALALTKGS